MTRAQSLWHMQDDGQDPDAWQYQKFISPDGGNREAVYTGEGCSVNNDTNGPSYNFADPINDPIMHFLLDLAPYLALGNSPDDFSNPIRLKTTWDWFTKPSPPELPGPLPSYYFFGGGDPPSPSGG
jgi:hypothetical protein